MNRARFQKRVRLLTPAQFDRAFKEGRRLHQGPMSVVIASNTLGHPRLGFALAKKHAKRAVQRNWLKRLLREKFRHHQQYLQAVDLVVFLRATLPDQPEAGVDVVDRLWTKLNNTCAKS